PTIPSLSLHDALPISQSLLQNFDFAHTRNHMPERRTGLQQQLLVLDVDGEVFPQEPFGQNLRLGLRRYKLRHPPAHISWHWFWRDRKSTRLNSSHVSI